MGEAAGVVSDPVATFERSHLRLSALALEVSSLVRSTTPADASRLSACVQSLCDGLLEHFAAEEEGLFPFVRAHVPSKAASVDELVAAHDSICGALLRLAHVARSARPDRRALAALFERFEVAYATHAQVEAELLAGLGRSLEPRHRAELRRLLEGH
jgi:iron-sulfur cluster repair protein YtfE (RIC family)